MKRIASNIGFFKNIIFINNNLRYFQNDEKRLSKLEKNIKAEINEVIEASQDAHEQREDAKNKTIMLRSHAEKDLQQVFFSQLKNLKNFKI